MLFIKEGLCFDDVLLEPKKSEIKSRSDVDNSIFINKLGTTIEHPIIPANMKTIIGYDMAEAIYCSGGLGLLHRFMNIDDQILIVKQLENKFGTNVWSHIGFSVGVKPEDYVHVKKLAKSGARILCIDVAHGHSQLCIEMCEFIAGSHPDILLIAGNVATDSGAYDLWSVGADIVKVGVGPGSLCTTRIETGNGVPQLSALIDVFEARRAAATIFKGGTDKKQRLIISDGGIKNAGDIVKALCFADMVMIGNMFAGCEETPGEIVNIKGNSYKEYVGSSTHKANHIEGVAAIVPAKGSFKLILTKLMDGVRSGCSYQGVNNLQDLKKNPQFLRMTGAGLRESHAHDVTVL